MSVRSLAVAIVLGAAAVGAAAAGVRAAAPPRFRVDPAAVYYGERATARHPAEVSMARVFDAIGAWHEAAARPADPNDGAKIVAHWDLVLAANKRFCKAVRAVAAARGADLVAEKGAIDPPAEDLTEAAIAEVSKGGKD
jgi:hypothetical protein